MLEPEKVKFVSSVFLTFSGNCKKALTFYQSCFGGTLQFEAFDKAIKGYSEKPVISGSLLSDRIVIHGSDLVHSEGRKLGNYIAIFLPCKNTVDRKALIKKLVFHQRNGLMEHDGEQKLIEVTDAFDVRWVLGT